MNDWLRRAYDASVESEKRLLELLEERDRTIDYLNAQLNVLKNEMRMNRELKGIVPAPLDK